MAKKIEVHCERIKVLIIFEITFKVPFYSVFKNIFKKKPRHFIHFLKNHCNPTEILQGVFYSKLNHNYIQILRIK